jgi:hypothetical protein
VPGPACSPCPLTPAGLAGGLAYLFRIRPAPAPVQCWRHTAGPRLISLTNSRRRGCPPSAPPDQQAARLGASAVSSASPVRAVIRRGGFASVVVRSASIGTRHSEPSAQGQRACAYFGPALLAGAPHLCGTAERCACWLYRTDKRPPFCISQTSSWRSNELSVYVNREGLISACFSVTAGGRGLDARRQRAAAGQSLPAQHPHRDEYSDDDRAEKNASTTTVYCLPTGYSVKPKDAH